MNFFPLLPKNKNNKTACAQTGQAMIAAVILFMFVALVIMSGFSYSVLRSSKITGRLINSKKAYWLAEVGAEDVAYRAIKGMNYDNQEVIKINNNYATTTIVINGFDKELTAKGQAQLSERRTKIILTNGSGSSFNYGVQAGNGGVVLQNSSSINGNLFSNGAINGNNSNIIRGTVVSAGAGGLINNVHATSTAYAHSITNSYIEGSAYYYSNISGTTVDGTKYSGSPDQVSGEMPISDDKINEWKQVAEDGGIISSPCPYVINANATIGPKKINCDLQIKGSPIVTLNGMVWVVGNIEIENTATIKLDSGLGNKSVAIIADNPSNRTTSSKIELQNSAVFQGTGTAGTYVLALSMNNSAEGGGSEKAITVEQSVSGALLVYASHGEANIKNSVSLKEVTAYKIKLENTASITYETGLASLLFEEGPGGGYVITGWEEI